jgi:hypothetical protein
MIGPRKPADLTPENERELERAGIEEVRRFLASNSGQYLYITSGPPSSQAKAWVRWKTERETFWIRAGICAAILAAFLALVSCILTVFAWQIPITPSK